MLVSLLVFALAACSNSSNEDTAKKDDEQPKDNTSETTDEQQYPITIQHAFGETVIEKSLSVSQQLLGLTMMLP